MKNVALFTGLPKSKEKFLESIGDLTELRSAGMLDRILFVTWKGRLQGKTDLKNSLQKHNVEIIEAEESSISGMGNIWHQMKALDIGLEHISNDTYVLKTRPDVLIKKPFLKKKLFQENNNKLHENSPGLMEERIWIPWFEITKPFYMADETFYGRKRDLDNLVNYDARYDVLYDLDDIGKTHVRRYVHPYLDKYPFLKRYLMDYNQTIGVETQSRFDLLSHYLESANYLSFLSIYYKIIMDDFYVHGSPVSFRQWLPPQTTLSKESFLSNFNEHAVSVQDWNILFCYRSSWLDNYVDDPESDMPGDIISGINTTYREWENHELDPRILCEDMKKKTQIIESEDGAKQAHNSVLFNYVKKIINYVGVSNQANYIYHYFDRF